MKYNFADMTLEIKDKTLDVNNLAECLVKADFKEVTKLFEEEKIVIPRKIRMDATRSALRPGIVKTRAECLTLDSQLNYRLLWFNNFSEGQLTYYFDYFKDRELNKIFAIKFYKNLLVSLSKSEDNEKLVGDICDIAIKHVNYIEKDVDVKKLFTAFDPYFVDRPGEIDGLKLKDFRPVLYNSATKDQITKIGNKYGVTAPKKIHKSTIGPYVIERLKAMKVDTTEFESKISDMKVKDIRDFALENGLQTGSELNKKELIEYILQRSPQFKDNYENVKSDREYEMNIPISDEEAVYEKLIMERARMEEDLKKETQALKKKQGEELEKAKKELEAKMAQQAEREKELERLQDDLDKKSETADGMDFVAGANFEEPSVDFSDESEFVEVETEFATEDEIFNDLSGTKNELAVAEPKSQFGSNELVIYETQKQDIMVYQEQQKQKTKKWSVFSILLIVLVCLIAIIAGVIVINKALKTSKMDVKDFKINVVNAEQAQKPTADNDFSLRISPYDFNKTLDLSEYYYKPKESLKFSFVKKLGNKNKFFNELKLLPIYQNRNFNEANNEYNVKVTFAKKREFLIVPLVIDFKNIITIVGPDSDAGSTWVSYRDFQKVVVKNQAKPFAQYFREKLFKEEIIEDNEQDLEDVKTWYLNSARADEMDSVKALEDYRTREDVFETVVYSSDAANSGYNITISVDTFSAKKESIKVGPGENEKIDDFVELLKKKTVLYGSKIIDGVLVNPEIKDFYEIAYWRVKGTNDLFDFNEPLDPDLYIKNYTEDEGLFSIALEPVIRRKKVELKYFDETGTEITNIPEDSKFVIFDYDSSDITNLKNYTNDGFQVLDNTNYFIDTPETTEYFVDWKLEAAGFKIVKTGEKFELGEIDKDKYQFNVRPILDPYRKNYVTIDKYDLLFDRIFYDKLNAVANQGKTEEEVRGEALTEFNKFKPGFVKGKGEDLILPKIKIVENKVKQNNPIYYSFDVISYVIKETGTEITNGTTFNELIGKTVELKFNHVPLKVKQKVKKYSLEDSALTFENQTLVIYAEVNDQLSEIIQVEYGKYVQQNKTYKFENATYKDITVTEGNESNITDLILQTGNRELELVYMPFKVILKVEIEGTIATTDYSFWVGQPVNLNQQPKPNEEFKGYAFNKSDTEPSIDTNEPLNSNLFTSDGVEYPVYPIYGKIAQGSFELVKIFYNEKNELSGNGVITVKKVSSSSEYILGDEQSIDTVFPGWETVLPTDIIKDPELFNGVVYDSTNTSNIIEATPTSKEKTARFVVYYKRRSVKINFKNGNDEIKKTLTINWGQKVGADALNITDFDMPGKVFDDTWTNNSGIVNDNNTVIFDDNRPTSFLVGEIYQLEYTANYRNAYGNINIYLVKTDSATNEYANFYDPDPTNPDPTKKIAIPDPSDTENCVFYKTVKVPTNTATEVLYSGTLGEELRYAFEVRNPVVKIPSTLLIRDKQEYNVGVVLFRKQCKVTFVTDLPTPEETTVTVNHGLPIPNIEHETDPLWANVKSLLESCGESKTFSHYTYKGKVVDTNTFKFDIDVFNYNDTENCGEMEIRIHFKSIVGSFQVYVLLSNTSNNTLDEYSIPTTNQEEQLAAIKLQADEDKIKYYFEIEIKQKYQPEELFQLIKSKGDYTEGFEVYDEAYSGVNPEFEVKVKDERVECYIMLKRVKLTIKYFTPDQDYNDPATVAYSTRFAYYGGTISEYGDESTGISGVEPLYIDNNGTQFTKWLFVNPDDGTGQIDQQTFIVTKDLILVAGA